MRTRLLLTFVLVAAAGGTAIAGGSGGKGGSSCPSQPLPPPPPPTPLQEELRKAVTDLLTLKRPIDCKGSTQYWGPGTIHCFKQDYMAADRLDARIERTLEPLMYALRKQDRATARVLLLTLSAFPGTRALYLQGELAYEFEPLRAAVDDIVGRLDRAELP